MLNSIPHQNNKLPKIKEAINLDIERKFVLVGSYQGYNLESYVKLALERLGHSVNYFTYYGLLGRLASPVRMSTTRSAILRELARPLFLNKINKKLKEALVKSQPRYMLTVKGEIILPSTLDYVRKELGIKTILWFPDDPHFFNGFTKHVAPHYDYVFTSSKKAISRYEQIGVKNVTFLPFACEPSMHKTVTLSPEEKTLYGSDVSLVGTYYPRRQRILNKLHNFNINVYGPYWKFLSRKKNIHKSIWGPNMVKVFNASKIVLDIYDPEVLKYQPSARTFEATGSGAFLLTEHPPNMEELFEIGKEIVCYKDEVELLDLLAYYLDADEERKEISVKGQERAYRDHTIDERMRFLIKTVS
jgi:spore maturation protein CgeB